MRPYLLYERKPDGKEILHGFLYAADMPQAVSSAKLRGYPCEKGQRFFLTEPKRLDR